MQNKICITSYNAICNIGNNIDDIFSNALIASQDFLKKENFGIESYYGIIDCDLPQISNPDFDIRCNRILLYLLNSMKNSFDKLLKKYSKDKIGVVIATTNTGVEEFCSTNNKYHSEIGNPAEFVKCYLGLNGFCQGVSTACSSGIKAFSVAKKVIDYGFCDAVIVAGVDGLSRIPIYGFNSLGVLSSKKCNPFSKNRDGINIGEGGAVFIVEKGDHDFLIKGIGETSDAYHQTCPDPNAKEAIRAINLALEHACLNSKAIDYINLHGTGTVSNDTMESNAINTVFGENTPSSSTKSLTGHCLGASASIEIALCLKAINEQKLIPHVYDNVYDNNLKKINLIKTAQNATIKNILCNSFGFGGTNSTIIIGRND